ncbi:D-alanyl-D-alanine carboxypeptidase family protein [Microbacterium gorillae]|uniref:hypothetical protein n=1 Tax=Microbacterium gorillae TaxID=1231063 RepID=UPI0006944CC8|nr:hypothetical protein [Microbacterium gorillae]
MTFVALLATIGLLAMWTTAIGTAEAGTGRGSSGGTAPVSVELDTITWPAQGEAAVAIEDGPILTSSDEPLPMASISKVITALMILEARPLELGESGDSFRITQDDERNYEAAMDSGKSALPVPVGGSLTQYELLEGMLIGSACNYADLLVQDIWGSDDAFVAAAADFLDRHDVSGVTMVEPTGFDPRNTATPAALIEVGRLALANPVVAEIVVKQSVDLPGAGQVENTNDLLADPGALGIKTGTLDGYNLLSARDLTGADGTPRRAFVVVLGQTDDDSRYAAARALYAQVAGLSG